MKIRCKSCIDNYFYFSYLCYECAKNCETTYNNCKCLICQKGYYFDIYKCFKWRTFEKVEGKRELREVEGS